MLEKAASHKLAFLQVLHLLLECPPVCDLLEASLAVQVDPMHMDCIRQVLRLSGGSHQTC